MKQQEFKDFLYEICEDCDCHSKKPYCTLVEFIISAHKSHRMMMQVKCVEKFGYEKHPNTSWNEAFQFWVDEGYAKIFGSLYTEEIRFRSLYSKIMNESK